MKNFILYAVIALIILYLYIQWKKKRRSDSGVDRNTQQTNDSTLSNVANARADVTTGQDLIDNNAGKVNSSATADNPLIKENAQASVISQLGSVGVASVPMVPVKPVIAYSPGTVVTDQGVITNQQQIDTVAADATAGIFATLPDIGQMVSNSALWTNMSLGNNRWSWYSVDGKLSFISDATGRRTE